MGGSLKRVNAVLGLQIFYPKQKRVPVGLQVYFDGSSDAFTETNNVIGHRMRMILDSQPEMVVDILVTLRGLRTAERPVNASIARNIILGYIAQWFPILWDSMPHRDDAPVFSIWITPRCLKLELNWVVCSGISVAQKLSSSWNTDGEKIVFRLSFSILNENIHPSMVINTDQTGLILVPEETQWTYEEHGVKQVLIPGKEEKRAFTAMLPTSLDGTVLP
jgi:hypothetical protein